MTEQVNLPLWIDYIETHIGFVLPKQSHQWLMNAVTQTALNHHVSANELFDKIKQDQAINQALIDAITIAETRFFRDKNAIDYIAKLYKAQLQTADKAQAANSLEPFKIVSIGVSTGQELWSIGLVCQYISDELGCMPNYQLVGLDVSQKSLDSAKACRYPMKFLGDIETQFYRYVDMPSYVGRYFQIVPKIQSRSSFALCNLFDKQQLTDVLSSLDCARPDVIICQNVLIYFR